MEITILNSSFEAIGIIDTFESLIWTDRYNIYGDFELSKIPDASFLSMLSNGGMYISNKDSEHVMVIETINIKSDVEKGDLLYLKGKSIENLLNRRILWTPMNLTGNFQDTIETLLNENAISPTDPDRTISLLEFEASIDPTITVLEINSQFVGATLYEIIRDVCIEKNLGFKLTLSSGKLKFKLYNGVDRSYNQILNPYVIFSPRFDNLVNSDYSSSDEFFKTVALVMGENDNVNPIRMVAVSISPDGGSDLLRREMFVDASSITRRTDGDPLSDEEYDALLAQKGMEELAKNTFDESFEGQADITRGYVFGQDFFMGDILQIANEYGNEGQARLIEIIRSEDSSGEKIYPTFKMITNIEGE